MAKILVVDDDPNNRLLLKSILGYDEHVVIEAETGAIGLQRVAQHVPDLVIVDLYMPDVDGVTFVRTLRGNPSFAAIEIALYTGTALTAAIETFLELYRVRTVIPKPSEPEEVLQRVREALTSN